MKEWKIELGKPFPVLPPLAACIGYFDGLHLGHKALVDKTVELKVSEEIETAIITFDPDPWVTIRGMTSIHHLTSMNQRKKLAENYGIQNWIVLCFTSDMAKLSHETFTAEILGKLNLKSLVCGFDFHYGDSGKGNTASLIQEAAHLFQVHVIDAVMQNGEKISSTRITNLVLEGRMEEAAMLLNYPYTLEGTVIHGFARGRTLGFPTANLNLTSEALIPLGGVYAGFCRVKDHRYLCMINVGSNPTFTENRSIIVEVHLLDFEGDLYDQPLAVSFVKRLRDEVRFDSKEALISQMTADREAVKRFVRQ